MTPKEKAKELYNKFYSEFLQFDKGCDLNGRKKYAIKSSLLCVGEVISQWDYVDTYLADLNGELNPNLKYWHEVKDELSLL